MISIILILLFSILSPTISAVNLKTISAFEKGPSYKPVVPIKKITLVEHQTDSYLDDYAYLAAIPTAVFEENNKLFSHPLLFYEDEYDYTDNIGRSFNARQGLDYFMDDWMQYSDDHLDQFTTINVQQSKIPSNWKSKNNTIISSDDPFTIASELAIHDWSYADSAIVAVIDESFNESETIYNYTVEGEIPVKNIKEEHFEVKQTNQLDPIFHDFNVPEGYHYLKGRAWYPCFYISLDIGTFQGLANISIPSGDKDLQLYCYHNGDWMQTAAVSGWNQKFGMDIDYAESYVYKNGPWRVGITDVPTKGLVNHIGSISSIIQQMIFGVTYNVDITMYPGIMLPMPENPPYGCRNIDFTLKWNNDDIPLGFSVIGPAGEEITTSTNETTTSEVIHLDQLGQCLTDEHYQFCVYAKEDTHQPLDFIISYTWQQNITEAEGYALGSAAHGAVLGSIHNSPLLYMKKDMLPDVTAQTLCMLGVKEIILVDLGNTIQSSTYSQLNRIAPVINHYTENAEVYNAVKNQTQSNDVIFTTIDPYTYWYVTEMKPGGEYPAALPIGPATYLAAHHGSPVIIIDNHAELNSAVVWHNEFWKRIAHNPAENDPPVAEMHLTGVRVYNFLQQYGFDEIGREVIITVAGQFDIAPSWTRMFAGKAYSGLFLFSPVDQAYWIARNMFYPALVFMNPAMSSTGVELTTGGENKRKLIGARGPFGLTTLSEPHEVLLDYPIQLTFASYTHRFNERASKYYGFLYQSADGIIPGETRSFEPIDQGSIEKYTGKQGSFWPDLSASDVIPFYMEKGGYEIAYCSNFVDTMNNLNEGVIYWCLASHGGNSNSGLLIFWDPTGEGAARTECMHMPLTIPGVAATDDLNPWRSYDWYLGSTEEPDTLSAEIHGIIPMILGNPNLNGLIRSAMDYAPAKKPIRDIINNALSKVPIINRILPAGMIDTQDYYDGQICGALISTLGYTWYTGYAMDEELENLHSMIFITNVCLTATKYTHMMMVRHGSTCQIIDPWSTSWYGTLWLQSIHRDVILGDTIGEAYNKGISHVGILHIGDDTDPPQWWWDNNQNVCLYGDPSLRMFVPTTDYSDSNYWEIDETQPIDYDTSLNVQGHSLFGATSHPHERQPPTLLSEYLIPLIAMIVIIILVLFLALIRRK